jgi:hypothetical protein
MGKHQGPANGSRISRRERAAYESAKMPTISREAVGLHAHVGWRLRFMPYGCNI